MSLFRLFSTDALDRLEAAVFTTLGEAGLLVQDEVIRKALARAGARVGGPGDPVRFPRAVLEAVVRAQKEHAPAAGKRAELGVAGDSREPRIGLGTSVCQFFFDWAKKERRAPTVDDFLLCLRFGDVHYPEAGVGHMLLLRGSSPRMQNLEAVYLLMQHAHRVGHGYVHFGEQVPYFAEMGRIWDNDPRRFLGCCIFAATPLRYDERACGVMRAMADLGMSPAVGTMVTSGASAPVTVPGAIVIGAAEILGGMAMQHALAAPPPYSGGIATGSMDLRRANSDFASPEAMLQDIGITELFDLRFGGRTDIWGRSDYTCGRLPGLQAAYERCFEAAWCTLSRGYLSGFGSGLVESGKTLCLEQLLVDEEVARMHWRVARGVEVNDETIALPEILRIGVGNGVETHLATEHTLRHMREAWMPALFDRGVWDDDRELRRDAELLDRAHQAVLETVSRYTPPQPDPGKLAAVRQVLERARRQFGA